MAGKITAILAAASLAAVPAAAQAHRADHGKGHAAPHAHARKPRPVPYEFSGVVKSVDAQAQTVTLTVRQANRGGRSFRRQDVTFDLSHARLVVRDVNHDGSRDLGDVAAGDRAVVLALLPRDTTYSAGTTYVARGAVFTHPRHARPQPPSGGGANGGGYQDPFAGDS